VGLSGVQASVYVAVEGEGLDYVQEKEKQLNANPLLLLFVGLTGVQAPVYFAVEGEEVSKVVADVQRAAERGTPGVPGSGG